MRARFLVAIGLVGCSTTPPQTQHGYRAGTQSGSPWPVIAHDEGATARAPVAAARSNHVRWTFDTGSFVGTASPVIAADGTVYIGNSAGTLTAVHPDGTLAWRTTIAGAIEGAPAIARDGSVYVASDDARLHVFTNDGIDTTSAVAPDSLRSSVLLDDTGAAYFTAHGQVCTAKRGGEIVCQLPAEDWANVLSFAIADERLYLFDGRLITTYDANPVDREAGTAIAQGLLGAVADDGTVYADVNGRVEAHDVAGAYIWSCDIPMASAYAFEIYGFKIAVGGPGLVYVQYPTGVVLLSSAGVVWLVDVGATVSGGIAVDSEGAIYFGADDANLYAFDFSGKPMFTAKTGASVKSSPAIGADGTVYFGSNDGLLYAVGP